MDINLELRAAVRERVALGHHRAAILQELRGAGYSVAEAEAVYAAVASERGVDGATATPPASAAAPAEPAPAPDPAPPATNSGPTFFSRHPGLAIASIVLLLGLGGVVAASTVLDLSGWRSYVPFLSAPPYTEVTLLPGLADDLVDRTRVAATSEGLLALESRAEDTPEAFPDAFAGLSALAGMMGGALPENAQIQANVTTDADTADPDNVRATIQGTMNIDFDIVNMTMSGSLRQIGLDTYGRIDEFPSTMRSELMVPVGTWIQLADAATYEELPNGSVPFSVPNIPAIPGSVSNKWRSVLSWLPAAFNDMTQTDLAAQMARVAGAVPGDGVAVEDTGYSEADRTAILRGVKRAWQAAPLTMFAAEPERTTINDEVVYRYDLMLDRARVATFLDALRTELQDYPELVVDLPPTSDLPPQALFDEFNRLVELELTVRPEGSLHGMRVESVVTSPDPAFTSQLRFRVAAQYSYPTTPLEVAVPSDLHPETLLEMIERQQREAEQAQVRQTLGSARTQAELYYNENDSSYAGLCTDLVGSFSFQFGLPEDGRAAECRATGDGYAVQHPVSQSDAFCVDSTGMATTVPYTAWDDDVDRITCQVTASE